MLGCSIYTIGARRRGVRLRTAEASLGDLSVAQALDKVDPLPAELPYDELLRLLGPTRHTAFPVVDGKVVAGVLSVREARRALLDPAVDRAVTARSFARPARTLLPDDDLGEALQRLGDAGMAEALVVDAQGNPLGVVTRESIFEAWRRATEAT
jgi:CBS domain-containing protein